MSRIKEQFEIYGYLHTDILSKIVHKKYYYNTESTYLKYLIENIKIANRIYWEEILLRAHFTSVTSILRNEKWLKGINVSIETNNYLLFAASLRGYLESVTDSYYSLLNTPFDLACNFNNIKSALNGFQDRLLVSRRLEETLIHYQFASKSKDVKPLFATKYIEIFDKYGDKDTKALYSKLCEVVHPAKDSINCFVNKIVVSDEFEYTTTNVNMDSKHIEKIMNEYSDVIIELLKMSISAPIICLRVLNLFKHELVESQFLDDCLINKYIDEKVWGEIIELVGNSKE
jgi:hypothetical protein